MLSGTITEPACDTQEKPFTITTPWPKWYTPPTKMSLRPSNRVNPLNLVGRAADALGVNVATIREQNKAPALVRTRWAIAHVMRDSYGRSYPEIGRDIGRDHATVVYGVQQSRKLVNGCSRHAALVNFLEMT